MYPVYIDRGGKSGAGAGIINNKRANISNIQRKAVLQGGGTFPFSLCPDIS